jgi:hypothetical protein
LLSQRDEYIHASVALKVRKTFERCVGVTDGPLDRGSRTMNILLNDGELMLEKEVATALTYTLQAATVATGESDTNQEKAWEHFNSELKIGMLQLNTTADHVAAIALLVALSVATEKGGANFDPKNIQRLVISRLEEDKVWTSIAFAQALKGMSELAELLTTPFMIQIIVTVSGAQVPCLYIWCCLINISACFSLYLPLP